MRRTIEHKVFRPYGDDELKVQQEILELLASDDFWEVKLVYGGNRPKVILERKVTHS